jgi:hypothetical protein
VHGTLPWRELASAAALLRQELTDRPAKSLPMQGIMLYFSGSGVQIFSLGMIFMLLTSPISAVFNVFKGGLIRAVGISSQADG